MSMEPLPPRMHGHFTFGDAEPAPEALAYRVDAEATTAFRLAVSRAGTTGMPPHDR